MTHSKAAQRVFKKEVNQVEFKQLLKLLNDAEMRWVKSGLDKKVENDAKSAYRFIADKIRELFDSTDFKVSVPDILRGRGMKYITISSANSRTVRVSF